MYNQHNQQSRYGGSGAAGSGTWSANPEPRYQQPGMDRADPRYQQPGAQQPPQQRQQYRAAPPQNTMPDRGWGDTSQIGEMKYSGQDFVPMGQRQPPPSSKPISHDNFN